MKKILALVLAAMLVLSIAPLTFAADPGDFTIGESGNTTAVGGKPEQNSGRDYATIRPGASYKYALSFVDGNGNVARMTKTDVKAAKLDVKTKVSAGSKAIDTVEIAYETIGTAGTAGYIKDAAYIKVAFINPYVSTGSLDFDFTAYLTKNKSKISGTEVQFTGTLENEVQEVDENDDYVNLTDTPVVKSTAYIKNIDVEIGAGVTITAKFFNDKKYFGRATNKVKSGDDATLTQYPDIDSIFYLDTVGLNSSGNTVDLGLGDKSLFVYNADLELVGNGNEKLPYSTKYFVSSKELDVESDEDLTEAPDDGGDIDDPGSNPDMGGDDVPENVNDNPGTGC